MQEVVIQMRYKLNDDDKTLAHNPADQPKDPKRAMKKVSKDMKRTKNPGYAMDGY